MRLKNMLWVFLVTGPVAFVAGIGIRLFIRVAAGLMGGIPLSKIVTEDFGHWTLRSLLRLRAWGNVLKSGVESGWAGLFVVTTICLIAMSGLVVYVLYFTLKGGMPALPSGEVFASVFVSPFIIIMAQFIGFLFGFIIGIFVGIPRICRETARFVNIHSPYQRLRAGVIFNVLQLVVVGWCLFLSDRLSTLPSYWRGTAEYRFSLFPPTLWLFLIFGLIGLFRTPLLKHLTLRVCLTLEGAVPLRYAGFLNYATGLGILERDGGQWRFRHQILQEHFARRYQDESSSLVQTRKNREKI